MFANLQKYTLAKVIAAVPSIRIVVRPLIINKSCVSTTTESQLNTHTHTLTHADLHTVKTQGCGHTASRLYYQVFKLYSVEQDGTTNQRTVMHASFRLHVAAYVLRTRRAYHGHVQACAFMYACMSKRRTAFASALLRHHKHHAYVFPSLCRNTVFRVSLWLCLVVRPLINKSY